MKVGDTFYRYEERFWAPSLDEFENPRGRAHSTIELIEFEVLKVTAKGAWITRAPTKTLFGVFRFHAEKRFVNLSAHKRYALPSKAEAITSFIARKERQASILEARAAQARELIWKAGLLKPSLNPDQLPQNEAITGHASGVADGTRTHARLPLTPGKNYKHL